MNYNNNASRLKREVMIRSARLALEGRLAEGADRIPYEMTAEGWETIRCCKHHDRAILRLRTMAVLGADPEGLDDADRPLADCAREALARAAAAPEARKEAVAGRRPLALIGEACNACVKTRYLVTEACQGCLARPCKMNCPKGALVVEGGRARIDPAKCVNCGLCMKNCPYTAIVKLPVPCEEACPVGAISKGLDGVERIDHEKCVLCGKCVRECPFGAVVERSELVDVALELKAGKPAVALVAPAVAVQFPGGLGRLKAALRLLGFAAVMEVARGAETTAEREAEELVERMEKGEGFLATSCCPAWTRTARKHLPALLANVSSTPSPMAFAAELAAREAPGALRVFVGPCAAKRGEAAENPLVDRVLTAEELGALFVAAGVDVGALEPEDATGAAPGARAFAASGGVAAAVAARLSGADAGAASAGAAPRLLVVNGISKQGLMLMETWAAKPPEADLVEVMACEGGCVGGACVLANPRLAKLELDRMVAAAATSAAAIAVPAAAKASAPAAAAPHPAAAAIAVPAAGARPAAAALAASAPRVAEAAASAAAM